MSKSFDTNEIRVQFPALTQRHQEKIPVVFLDNPGGTQVHQSVIDATYDHVDHGHQPGFGA
jgi:selenocysteine lyase/cysteine desulfurase